MSETAAMPFSGRVSEGLRRRGMTMRQLCRAVSVDPSFFSKVLAGKRSPPMEEEVLRRIAAELELDAAELIVAAGRIPAEWTGIWTDSDLYERVNAAATGKKSAPAAIKPAAPPASAPQPAPRVARKSSVLSEELL